MFIMMNAARFAVGMQGVAVSDRAYQHALAYAAERVQSRPVDGSSREAVTIIHHPDVRRILGTMRAVTEAGRALAYTAGHADRRTLRPTRRPARAIWRCRNTWCPSSRAGAPRCRSRSPAWGAGARRHGLHRETGAAQFYRDARILAIYEGTTAIQANDQGPQDAARRRRRGALAAGPGAPDRGCAAGPQRSGRHPRGRPAQGGPRGAGQRRGLRAGQRGRQDQRRVRRGRALPDAGRHHAGRLADGARAAGQPGPQAGRSRVPRRQDRHGAGLCAAQADPGAGAGRRGARLGRVRSTAPDRTDPGWPRSTGGQPDRSRINPRRSGTAPHAASRPRRAAASPARTTAPPR